MSCVAVRMALVVVSVATTVAPTLSQLGSSDAAGATQDEAAHEVAPRIKLAGIDSVRTRSNVRFAVPQAVPHVLDCTFAFPGRARIALRPAEARPSERTLRYRRGLDIFAIGMGEGASVRLEGAAQRDELLHIEARLALFVWPEAHTWSGSGLVQRAELPGIGALEVELEAFVAQGDSEPARADKQVTQLRPRRVRALRADGLEVETLIVSGWAKSKDPTAQRVWPTGLRLVAQGVTIWDETFTDVLVTGRWDESWFIPPDRRISRNATDIPLLATDAAGAIVRDVALDPEEGPWTLEAAAKRARVHAAQAERDGHTLETGTVLVLDGTLTPRAVRLVLAGEPGATPDGWRVHSPTPAWIASLDQLSDVVPAGKQALRAMEKAQDEARFEVTLTLLEETPRGGVRLMLRLLSE
ncbi:MAG: hypothetical protein R3F49_23725 [Planctomycetota bacterium]